MICAIKSWPYRCQEDKSGTSVVLDISKKYSEHAQYTDGTGVNISASLGMAKDFE